MTMEPVTRSSAEVEARLIEIVEEVKLHALEGRAIDLSVYEDEPSEVRAQLAELAPLIATLAELHQPADDKRPGDTIEPAQVLGDFRIVDIIGRGGMGVVYEAEQISLNRRVALKVLPFAAVLDDRQLSRFRNEAMAAAQLNHPAIVDVYYVGEDRGVHFFAMEYVDGEDLLTLLSDLRALAEPSAVDRDAAAADWPAPLDELVDAVGTGSPIHERPAYFDFVARVGIQVADALEHAHQCGVVHRDIKPGNLMVNDEGNVWITDFGLARLESDVSLTLSGDVVGTLRYMSPEQTCGTAFGDPRSDVYSLGATLYELLTLEPLVGGAGRRELTEQILAGQPTSPGKHNPAIPRELETVILRATAKEPVERYPSAQEFAADLERFLNHVPVLARRPSLWQHAAKWGQRHRRLVQTAIASLVIISIVLGLNTAWIAREQGRTAQAWQLARQLLYAADMKLAAQAFDGRDVHQVAELIKRHGVTAEADLRGLEWRYLSTRSQARGTALVGHRDAVYIAVYSPDHQWLATAGASAVVLVREARSGRIIQRLPTGQGEVNGLAFSSDGDRLATAGDDGSVRIWDWRRRRELLRFDAHEGQAYNLIWVDQDKTLLSCGLDPVVRIWDAASGKQIGELVGHERAVEALALTADGSRLATASSDRTARIWDWRRGKLLRVLAGHQGRLSSLAFCHDDQCLATSDIFGEVSLWDLSDGSRRTLGSHLDGVQSLRMAPGGSLLATGDRQGVIRLWSLDGQEVRAWKAHDGYVYCIQFDSQTPPKLVSVGGDGKVMCWRTSTRPLRRAIAPIADDPEALAFLPRGKQLAVVEPDAVVVCDAESVEQVRRLAAPKGGLVSVGVADNGRRLAAGTSHGDVCLWELETGRLVANWSVGPNLYVERPVFLDPAGTQLAVGYSSKDDDGVAIVRADDGHRLRTLKTLGRPIIQLSPDRRTLAVAAQDDVVLYGTADWTQLRVLKGHSSTVQAVAFHPDSRQLATVGNDRRLILWRLDRDQPLANLTGHRDDIRCVSYASDGRTIVTGGSDGEVHLWHPSTQQPLFPLLKLEHRVAGIAHSTDGRHYAFRVYSGQSLILDMYAN